MDERPGQELDELLGDTAPEKPKVVRPLTVLPPPKKRGAPKGVQRFRAEAEKGIVKGKEMTFLFLFLTNGGNKVAAALEAGLAKDSHYAVMKAGIVLKKPSIVKLLEEFNSRVIEMCAFSQQAAIARAIYIRETALIKGDLKTALGANEQAAKLSGLWTEKHEIGNFNFEKALAGVEVREIIVETAQEVVNGPQAN